ncbi:unnamed protein product [Diatraea saccharalis]|uniref:Uncharacterized protein n=1 Tax=Diatraea saccharalis TaxID=40085 RepID=A0A9N9RF08_9NEOP|nr:unnamed protein product [Diatraea saccharalis]
MAPLSKSNSFVEQNLPHIAEEDKEKVKKHLLTYNVLVQDTYENTKKNCERNILKRILKNKCMTKYVRKSVMSRSVLGLKRSARQRKMIKKNNSIVDETLKFYDREDVSRATAGKKEFKTQGMIETTNLNDTLSMVVCNLDSKACAYGECLTCCNKCIEFNEDTCDMNEIVTWDEFATKKVVKKEVHDKLKALTSAFNEDLKIMKKHVFNIKHQYAQYLSCITNLKSNEVAIHIDFSENYLCKLSTEVQPMHFGASKPQGAADGVGGALKRRLDDLVKHGTDIPDAHTAYTLIKNSDTAIMIFYIREDDIAKTSVEEDLVPVPQTMMLHQICNTDETNVIRFSSTDEDDQFSLHDSSDDNFYDEPLSDTTGEENNNVNKKYTGTVIGEKQDNCDFTSKSMTDGVKNANGNVTDKTKNNVVPEKI